MILGLRRPDLRKSCSIWNWKKGTSRNISEKPEHTRRVIRWAI